MEDIKEIIETENNKEQNEFKTKKKKINIFLIIFNIIAILLIAYFAIGYINFIKLKTDKEPIFVVSTKTYNYDVNTTITVYDNIIYKVVKQENKDKNIMYSLKLWFMSDMEVSNEA
jgi:flagellar basal body-associated protein FliL